MNNNTAKRKDKIKSSTKLFFSGVLVLTITNLVVKAIGLLFKIPMNHIVGDEGMGYYNSAYTFYTYLYMVSTAGLPTAVSIMISESRAKGKIKQVNKILKIALLTFIVIGIVSTMIMFFGAGLVSNAIGAVNTRFSMMAIAPTLLFICISSALRGYFQGYQQMVPTAVSELLEAICKLGIGIAFAMFAIKQGYEIYVVAAYAVVGLTVGAGLGMLYMVFSKIFFRAKNYDAEYIADCGINDDVEPTSKLLKRLILIALPITISSSVMSLTNLIDATIVQRLLQLTGLSQPTATELYGNYTSLAVPMFNLPPVLVYPISYSIVPLLSAAREKGDTKRVRVVSESSMKIALMIGLPCGFGLCALARPILALFYKQSSVALAAPLLTLLGPSTAFICILAITNALLQSAGYERKPLISMLAGAGVKLVTNFFLIQYIGMKGTPISTFLCYLTVTSLNIFFLRKYTGLKPNFFDILFKPMGAAAVCAVAAYFSNKLFEAFLPGKIAVLCAIIVAVVVYFAVIFIIRGISEDEVLLLPKGQKIAKLLKKLNFIK